MIAQQVDQVWSWHPIWSPQSLSKVTPESLLLWLKSKKKRISCHISIKNLSDHMHEHLTPPLLTHHLCLDRGCPRTSRQPGSQARAGHPFPLTQSGTALGWAALFVSGPALASCGFGRDVSEEPCVLSPSPCPVWCFSGRDPSVGIVLATAQTHSPHLRH